MPVCIEHFWECRWLHLDIIMDFFSDAYDVKFLPAHIAGHRSMEYEVHVVRVGHPEARLWNGEFMPQIKSNQL